MSELFVIMFVKPFIPYFTLVFVPMTQHMLPWRCAVIWDLFGEFCHAIIIIHVFLGGAPMRFSIHASGALLDLVFLVNVICIGWCSCPYVGGLHGLWQVESTVLFELDDTYIRIFVLSVLVNMIVCLFIQSVTGQFSTVDHVGSNLNYV